MLMAAVDSRVKEIGVVVIVLLREFNVGNGSVKC